MLCVACSSIAVHFRQMGNDDYYGNYQKTIFVLAVVFGLMNNVIEFINLGAYFSFVFNIVYHIVLCLQNCHFRNCCFSKMQQKLFW